jgi:hypothetical protein
MFIVQISPISSESGGSLVLERYEQSKNPFGGYRGSQFNVSKPSLGIEGQTWKTNVHDSPKLPTSRRAKEEVLLQRTGHTGELRHIPLGNSSPTELFANISPLRSLAL